MCPYHFHYQMVLRHDAMFLRPFDPIPAWQRTIRHMSASFKCQVAIQQQNGHHVANSHKAKVTRAVISWIQMGRRLDQSQAS